MGTIRIGSTEHPKHLVDTWSVCETLRRFGFRPEEMSVSFGSVTGVGDNVLSVNLVVDGVEFTTAAAQVEAEDERSAMDGWAEMWQAVMHATDEELAVALSKSVSGEYPRIVRLAAELVSRGILVPFLRPDETSPLVLIVPNALVMSRGGSA